MLAFQAARFLGDRQQLQRRQVGVYGLLNLRHQGRQFKDGTHIKGLPNDGLDQQLLVFGALDIAQRKLSKTHKFQRLRTIKMLYSLVQVDVGVLSTLVIHVLGHVDGYAAKGVDNIFESRKIGQHIVVQRRAKKTVNGLHGQSRAPIHVGRVDFLNSVSCQIDARVARHGKQTDQIAIGIDGHDDHRVGPTIHLIGSGIDSKQQNTKAPIGLGGVMQQTMPGNDVQEAAMLNADHAACGEADKQKDKC